MKNNSVKIFTYIFVSISLYASDNIEDYNITFVKLPEKSHNQKIKNMSIEEFEVYMDQIKKTQKVMNNTPGQIGKEDIELKRRIENKRKKQ